MSKRIVIDPVTRIEGHLRIEAQIENGRVADAYSSGTMVRLIEEILKGRDPRDAWAFVGRVCGVCTTVHSLASVRAVENALDIVIPPNAELVRNIMYCSQFMHDHVVHFYMLHALDWVDVVKAMKADPESTSDLAQSISNYPKSSPKYFADLQTRIGKFIDSGQLGIFANGYWGHPAYKLPPEVNLIGLAHYLEALEWQKEIAKIHAIFGGKNPHPNYLVGGMACAVNLEEANAINAERLALVEHLLKEGKTFIEQVYIPDLMAIGSFYKNWADIGRGIGNYMVFGDLPENGFREASTFKFPPGVILNRDLSHVHDIDIYREEDFKEFIHRSWYSYSDGDETGKHPWEGESVINYTGPMPPYTHLNVDEKYSYLKTPRWRGHAMEVGPLARLLVGYARGNGEFMELVDEALTQLDLPVDALYSTLGRTLARGLETKLAATWALGFYENLISNIRNGDTRMANMEKFNPKKWPGGTVKGVGYSEAPRGALSHWIVIEDTKIRNYQMVVPTTWNASPRDPQGKMSAYESSLVGTPVADPHKPLELLRTVHSFDPCLACAVHLYDEHGTYVHQLDTF